MPRFPWSLCRPLGLALALCGWGCPDQHPPPGGADAGVDLGCPVRFAYRPQSTATSVFVAGEWDGFDRLAHPMEGPDSSGTYRASLSVPPGFHAYTFLVNGGEHQDPGTSLTRYFQGRPYSALRVRDCRDPQLAVVSLENPPGERRFTAVLEVTPGADRLEGTLAVPGSRAPGAGGPRPLSASELVLAPGGRQATLQLSGLADGKYTAAIRALGGERAGERILLPFWIEPERFAFTDAPLYMLMTDRFRDGDTGNNPPRPAEVPLSALFQGGDLRGVELAMREGYFDALGVRAIWLTPWQTQPGGPWPDKSGARDIMGYHGYWPVKAREVDPRLGGAEALHRLVEEAHGHGIRILMDTVLNHVHQEHEYAQAHPEWFRKSCPCGSAPACSWEEHPLTCLFAEYLPDVDWTVNAAAAQLVEDVAWWIEEFDLDGLRVDAVKHMEDHAMGNLATRVRERFETAGTEHLMFGETFSGDYGLLRRYIGPQKLDGQLDFALFFAVPEPVFARDDQGMQHAKYWTERSVTEFAGATMVTFVGNHDVPRFITKADPANRDRQGNDFADLPSAPVGQEPYDRLWLAMLHLFTTPGVPLLYYGDEYGEFGGSDPDNRHMLRGAPSLSPAQASQLARMRKLGQARRRLRGLSRGPLVHIFVNDEWGGKGNLYAYARPDEDPRRSAVVVLNQTADTWGNVVVQPPQALGWTSGMVEDVLTGAAYALAAGAVTVDVPGRGGVVLALK